MTEPWQLSLRAAAKRIACGELRPSVLVESCLERIEVREPETQAWELVDAEAVRRQARECDDRPVTGPLHGIPVGVKDIIDVEGLPTRCGSSLPSGTPAVRDARIVARLRAAGAVVLGKTVTTEYAYFTPGKTRNPHDPKRTPGGSSSGSAAAVADHMVPLAIGSQTAASTTRPAAYCGANALVTEGGQLHDPGITGLSHTLDSLGLFTRSVDDLALAAAAVLGTTAPTAADRPPAFRLCLEDLGGLDEEMRDAVVAAALRLQQAGARVTPMTMPVGALLATHRTIMAVEAARSLADEARTGKLSEPLQSLIADGRETSDAAYQAALEYADRQRDALLGQLGPDEVVLAPAAPGPAPLGMATGSPDFSRPWQVMRLPSITVAGLADRAGMPLGIQVVGRPAHVARLLAAAAWVEARL